MLDKRRIIPYNKRINIFAVSGRGVFIMKELKGALIFGQSGGPTSVINASAYGVFSEAFKHENITAVYGACYGIAGVLEEQFIDMAKVDKEEFELLKNTPSSALGSIRYKLKNAEDDETDYLRILEVFKKYNVRYFFYNGGNDSMDTCNKISKYLEKKGYECRVVGIPKTIDNDLSGTDHCPGYGSAAKYIATTCMEVSLDSRVYKSGQIVVVEIMGRHAGWLTAASAVASFKGMGPDLIYVPERDFDLDDFCNRVEKIWNERHNVFVAVSEGIHDKDGKLIVEHFNSVSRDSFNHVQLGGVGAMLTGEIKRRMPGVKVRAIELSLMQRCAAHLASGTDITEAVEAGRQGVLAALGGETDIMIGFRRAEGKEYKCEYVRVPLSQAANTETKLPDKYITADGTNIEPCFMDYVMPLIQGESGIKFVDGVPRFAKIK